MSVENSSRTLRCLPAAQKAYIRQNKEEVAHDLVKPIIALGYDEKTAAHYASLIVKNPCRDETGKIVVVETNPEFKELAALDLELFPNRGEVIQPDGEEPSNWELRIAMIREMISLGYDDKTAAAYAVAIGNHPELDQAGKVIVRIDGKEVARLQLASAAAAP